jgi:hypothetical protein
MSLCDEGNGGKEIGRAVLRFEARAEWRQLLRSIRVKVR